MRSVTLTLALTAVALPAAAEITLFSRDGFEGRSFSTQAPIRNLEREGFANRASSAIVRGGRYEICDDRRVEGNCMVLRPGQYPSLAAMGMDNAVTSVRPVQRQAVVEERRFAPPPPVAHDYRRRSNERIYEADVVDVRAVYGQPEQRCWVERESVPTGRSSEHSVPGAIVGGLIGGILGHQVGSGRGNDVATAAGAIGGAVLGSNVASNTYTSLDVQKCAPSRVSGPPQYYDVTYRFRGENRYVQMAQPPGPKIAVNANGEPRA